MAKILIVAVGEEKDLRDLESTINKDRADGLNPSLRVGVFGRMSTMLEVESLSHIDWNNPLVEK